MNARILDVESNAVLGDRLREIRSEELQRDRRRFRGNLRLCGTILGYEIGKTLETQTTQVRTSLGLKDVDVARTQPVLATALRAGLPFLEGMLEAFPASDVTFFGAARQESGGPDDDGSMKVVLDYEAISPMDDRPLIFVDPMVATGSTVIDIHTALHDRGHKPSRFIIAGLVGYFGAIERLQRMIPDAEIWFVTADPDLNDQGYIVPGLGDAGDLCYGGKV